MSLPFEAVAQFGIAFFGVAAIWLTQSSKLEHQRFACVFGLLSQPFWFASAWMAGQWGIFALSVIYSCAWGRGFYRHWIVGGVPR